MFELRNLDVAFAEEYETYEEACAEASRKAEFYDRCVQIWRDGRFVGERWPTEERGDE